jgi:HK97 gp10 family phage protein
MKVSARIEGIEDVARVLRKIPRAFSDKILLSANRSSARILVKKEKELAPKGRTLRLVNSIGTEKVSKIGVAVGPKRRAGRFSRSKDKLVGAFKGHHAHLVEFGTRRRKTKSGRNTGIMPAHPFVRPAFKQSIPRMQKEQELILRKSLNRTIKRVIK